MSIKILYRDNHLLCCIKPVGIPSEAEGLPSLLSMQEKVNEIYTVHRLDQAVGGVILYALSKKMAAALSSMIEKGEITKEYLAVTTGVPDSEDGVCKDLLYHDRQKNKTYVVTKPRKGVRDASLAWIRQSTTCFDGNDLALLRIALHTGRSHQIRVQMASRKLPLVGDGKYGSRVKSASIALWSTSISFRHPFSSEPVRFEASPPDHFPWNLFTRS